MHAEQQPQTEPRLYHVHIYFEDDTESDARSIYEVAQTQTDIESVGRFHPSPIGPHPVRQFQLLVRTEHLDRIETWLRHVRGNLDVLIHPEIDDDLLAHTELARWLGRPHELRLEKFRN